jgi:hypothetical protein
LLAGREASDKDPDANQERVKEDRKFLHGLAEGALRLAAELDRKAMRASSASAELDHEAMKASPAAAELDRDAMKSARLMAIAEETAGKYQSAHEQISHLIDSAQTALERVSHRDGSLPKVEKHQENLEPELFASRTVRARIGTKWAAQLRGGGGPQTDPLALRLIQGAVEDLDWCEQYLSTNQNKNPIFTYFLLSNRAPALLTLGEIEIDLERSREAGEHLRSTQRTIDQLTRFALDKALALPKDVPLWNQRLKGGLRRMGLDQDPAIPTPDRPESE